MQYYTNKRFYFKQLTLALLQFQYQKQFYFKKFSLGFKTVLFKIIQFIISTHFSSNLPIDRILSGASTPAQNGHGRDCNEGVLGIQQSSTITGTSSSDYLVS